MSQIIINLDELNHLITNLDDHNLKRLRIFAQFQGVSNHDKSSDSSKIKVLFRTIPKFQKNLADNSTPFLKYSWKSYDFYVNDKLYTESFIQNGLPLSGDVLDLRCLVQGGIIEIIKLDKLTLPELECLYKFTDNKEVSRIFFNLTRPD